MTTAATTMATGGTATGYFGDYNAKAISRRMRGGEKMEVRRNRKKI